MISVSDQADVQPVSHLTGVADPDCGGKSSCTCEKTKALNKAVAGSHKPLFYDNNFDYLCDPCYTDWHLGDSLKRLGVGEQVIMDVGGQYRLRYHNEQNMRNGGVANGLGLTGRDDNFVLHRTRLYMNTEIGNRLRVYAEMLDAVSNYENFTPRGIEENRGELQNLFVDVVALDGYNGTMTARVGRQELLYGNQRLVTPLDWANTRRTFEGAKLMWEGQNWDVDAFWVRPMRRDVNAIDPPNLDREMYGLYSTYKGLCCDNVELYWLALDYHDRGFLYDTLGARYWGGRGPWLYEFEGGYQFGRDIDLSDHSASSVTAGLGRKFECAPWQPTLWFYYDWASGGAVDSGYHHYEPLAHKYLGFMDLFGRRNIRDANVQLTMKPHEKVKLLLWYHYFQLSDVNDVPYNVNMTRYAGLGAGTSGDRDLGQELDIVATFLLTERLNVLFGYSHFFTGDYYDTTAGVGTNSDADFFYTQFHVNF